MIYFCQSAWGIAQHVACLAKNWFAAQSSKFESLESGVVWCEGWSKGRKTGSRSDLPSVKLIALGKSQHPLNLDIKSSGCTLFQMQSYQVFWPIINTKAALEVGLGSGSCALGLTLHTLPDPKVTLLETKLCRMPFENLARSPQKSLPLKASLACDLHSRALSRNDYSKFNVYHCAYTMAISHDFCSY